MRRTRWSAVMSVTVATTPFVWVSLAFLQVGIHTVSQEKLPVDTGLGGPSEQLRVNPTPSTHPFESVVGTLEVSCFFLEIVLLRGVPVGVVHIWNTCMSNVYTLCGSSF